MRDWLALPLSTSSSTQRSIENSPTNKVMEEDEDDGELEPVWITLLNAFVGINKEQLQEIREQNQSAEQCIEDLQVREMNNKPFNNKIVFKEEQQEEEVEDEHGDISDNEEEEEIDFLPYELKRTLSNSSIASSTDTDNSTPASSQIMGPSSSSSYHDKVPTTTTNTRLVEIHWNHGGKSVQITGEFDNWSGSVDMHQDTENSHVVTILIDATKDIEYKFIVDGEWKYAMDLPHRTDWRGNVNNVVYSV